MKIQWCIYNVAFPAAILVTIIYWSVLYPMRVNYNNFQTGFLDISLHGLNTVLIIIEQYLSSIPSRVLHVYQPMIYAALYMVCSGVLWSQTGIVLYPYVLDWERPAITTGVMCGFVLYLIVAQLVLFLIYRARKKVCRSVRSG